MRATRSKSDLLDAVKERLKKVLDEVRTGSPLYEAVGDLITAIDYEDGVLVESASQKTLTCLAALISGIIPREVAKAEAAKKAIRDSWAELVVGIASDDFDDLKNLIESIIDERVSLLMNQNDVVRQLQKTDHFVENGNQLDECIRGLRRFRESLLRNWPSPNEPFLPLDRDSIGKARLALKNGSDGLSKEQLVCRPSLPKP